MKKYIFIVLLMSHFFSAQQLSSVLEKNTIDLGELTTFKIKVSNLKGQQIDAKGKNELLPFHFEEEKDSIAQTSNEYYREIRFAIYEEGTFDIPELEFKIGEEIYRTVPYQVTVVNPVQDDQLNDIMNNKQVSLGWRDYWELYKFYVLGFLLLVAMVILLIGIVKYFKRDKDSPKEKTNKTLKLLKALQKKKYIENENFRAFYVELVDITRNFVTEQYRIPADVLLTDDLIHLMKETDTISSENEQVIEEVILRGDQVKFAKMFPDKATMKKDLEDIKSFVKNSTKDIELEQLRTGV
ncbi:MAG: hypothetical protein CSA38_05470 [Flavobacteriales bacterium]|nr:MAG: hypothetical protein CSA38_05470 [Flavobacteriales bacterium]